MSFFKGINKSVKKNLSFKNLVKVGTMAAGFIPVVGGAVQGSMQGLSDAHALKKQGKIEEANAKLEQASVVTSEAIVSNGAKFLNQTAKRIYESAPEQIKAGAGLVGSSVVDSTIKEWFKKHWKLIVGIVAGVFALFFIVPKLSSGSRRAHQRRFR